MGVAEVVKPVIFGCTDEVKKKIIKHVTLCYFIYSSPSSPECSQLILFFENRIQTLFHREGFFPRSVNHTAFPKSRSSSDKGPFGQARALCPCQALVRSGGVYAALFPR